MSDGHGRHTGAGPSGTRPDSSRPEGGQEASTGRVDAAIAPLAGARDSGLEQALSGAVAYLGDAASADRAALVIDDPTWGARVAVATWAREAGGADESPAWWSRAAADALDQKEVDRGRTGSVLRVERNAGGAPCLVIPLDLGERSRGALVVSGEAVRLGEELAAGLAPSLAAASARFVAVARSRLDTRPAELGLEPQLIPSLNHALRTPLNGVLGTADLLYESALPPEHLEAVSMIKASGRALLDSLNDAIDLAKLGAGQVELESAAFSLRETVYRTLKTVGGRAEDRGVFLSCQISPEVPDALLGDPFRVQQIVAGLLGLTIDLGGESAITLRINVSTGEADRALVHFALIRMSQGPSLDTLPDALAADGLDAIVSMLNDGATGLSVALARRLIVEMGGKLWADDVCDSGCVLQFTLDFPLQDPSDASGSTPGSAALRDLSVLLAVESPFVRDALVEMLQTWQMRPAILPGAEAAAATMLRAKERGEPFGLAIIELPEGGEGGELIAQELHEDTSPCQVPLILLHDGSYRSDPAQNRWDTDAPLHLTVPVSAGELFDAILIAMKRSERSGGGAGHAATGPATPGTRLRILVAEDHPMNRRLAVKLLERQGHEVTAVENGSEAVTAASASRYDVVLMDLQMPVMSGLEATQAIRARERDGDRLPIIAVTAHTLKEDRERCFAAGMDAYVSKPLDGAELVATIDRLVGPAVDKPHV